MSYPFGEGRLFLGIVGLWLFELNSTELQLSTTTI
jgi:hypothetical protein